MVGPYDEIDLLNSKLGNFNWLKKKKAPLLISLNGYFIIKCGSISITNLFPHPFIPLPYPFLKSKNYRCSWRLPDLNRTDYGFCSLHNLASSRISRPTFPCTSLPTTSTLSPTFIVVADMVANLSETILRNRLDIFDRMTTDNLIT